jgi:hypothetical protein
MTYVRSPLLLCSKLVWTRRSAISSRWAVYSRCAACCARRSARFVRSFVRRAALLLSLLLLLLSITTSTRNATLVVLPSFLSIGSCCANPSCRRRCRPIAQALNFAVPYVQRACLLVRCHRRLLVVIVVVRPISTDRFGLEMRIYLHIDSGANAKAHAAYETNRTRDGAFVANDLIAADAG